MPAALILDDDNNQGMLSLASAAPTAQAAGNKPPNLQYGGDITCEHSSSRSAAFVVPMASDDQDLSTSSSSANTDEPDCDVSQVGEDPKSTRAQHVETSSLVHAALDILNCTSSETLDLLAVMRALPCEPRIQSMACERLWVQSFEDEEALRLVEEGGVAMVVNAMARFPLHAHLQHCAGEILQNVAALEEEKWHKHEICARGGVTLLVQAMKIHSRNHSIQLCGCITMANLAESNTRNQEHIRQVGGVEAVLQARWYHGNYLTVAEGARQALEALGYDDPESC